MARQLTTLHAVRLHFPTDNSKSLLTKFYVLFGLLLTPFSQPTWLRFYGSAIQWLSFSFSFLMFSSLGNLNPAYVSSPQLLTAGIFIC